MKNKEQTRKYIYLNDKFKYLYLGIILSPHSCHYSHYAPIFMSLRVSHMKLYDLPIKLNFYRTEFGRVLYRFRTIDVDFFASSIKHLLISINSDFSIDRLYPVNNLSRNYIKNSRYKHKNITPEKTYLRNKLTIERDTPMTVEDFRQSVSESYRNAVLLKEL